MSVWEITNSWANDVAGVTHADDIELDAVASAEFWKQFEGLGSPLQWRTKPRLTAITKRGQVHLRVRSEALKARACLSELVGLWLGCGGVQAWR